MSTVDLIGTFVIGPKKLKGTQCESAAKKLRKRQAKLQDLWNKGDEGAAMQYIEKRFPLFLSDQAGEDNSTIVARLLAVVPEVVVANLQTVWSKGSRDCVSREVGKGRRVVFCGSATWANDVHGFGYQTIHAARCIGLLELLDIE
jgi:hypothetical protein